MRSMKCWRCGTTFTCRNRRYRSCLDRDLCFCMDCSIELVIPINSPDLKLDIRKENRCFKDKETILMKYVSRLI